MKFHYLASRGWMASEILAGNPVQNRRQVLEVDPGELDDDLLARAENVRDATEFVTINERRRACVLDSGIDPELSFGPRPDKLVGLDEPIIEEIGLLPELDFPTGDTVEVVEAWEIWIDAYVEAAAKVIEKFIADPPASGWNGYAPVSWTEGVEVELAPGAKTSIGPEDGAKALRKARAGRLWDWACAARFSQEGFDAAREAVCLSPGEARRLLELCKAPEITTFYLKQSKRCFAAAKAYDRAQAAEAPGFDSEMYRWAAEHGSNRLRVGLQDGYRMNARYLAERIAREAPGMYAMPVDSAKKGWAAKATSPSEAALHLRRRIAAAMERHAPPNTQGPTETEIVTVKKAPHEIYRADNGAYTEDGAVGQDLPSREGWPWDLNENLEPIGGDPIPFEAVIVKNWLGRFHLLAAVSDEVRGAPPGIWAVPLVDDYGEDGSVVPRDPDEPLPLRAKRKPRQPETEDDIPF
jgi:hypothetical protein